MNSLCVIPARGGSKRIPRKNLRSFCGRPIIAYSIDAALESDVFDATIVSTDDGEIADLAVQLGAEVPFFRSSEASSDMATLADVVTEVVARHSKERQNPEIICCLLPTAPFVTCQELRDSYYALLREENTTAVIPVVRFGYPIQRALQVDERQRVSMVWPEYVTARSQDLEPRYHDAGQYYFIRRRAFDHQRTLFPDGAVAHEKSELAVQDIDTEEDWRLAEMKFQLLS